MHRIRRFETQICFNMSGLVASLLLFREKNESIHYHLKKICIRYMHIATNKFTASWVMNMLVLK